MRTVVYTSLFAGSDTLKPAPVGSDRCVCYTDDPSFRDDPKGWDIELWRVVGTPRRTMRFLRCHSHELFPDADLVVWLDASFRCVDLPGLIAAVGDAEAVSYRHPERTTCYEEGEEIIALGQAPADLIRAQLDAYQRDGFAPTAITTPGIFVRRQTPRVAAFNRLWDAHIERYTVNDLISLDYCAWKVGLPITYLPGSYTDNPYVTYDAEDHHDKRTAYAW